MAYFLANLGRRHTPDRSIECLLSSAGYTVGTLTYRARVSGGVWTPTKAFKPWFRFNLPEQEGTYTIEVYLDDGVSNETITQEIVYAAANKPYMPWATETQRIANNLPLYSPGRRLRTSNWQKFLNAPGWLLQKISRKAQDVRNSYFLLTTPTNEMDLVGRIYPDPYKLVSQKSEEENLLSNPTYSLMTQEFGEPQEWAFSDTTTDGWEKSYSSTSLFGRHSIRCTPANGERATAVQSLPISLEVGEQATAALYYQTSISGSTTPPSSVDFALQVVLLYEDGDSEVSSVTLLPETDGVWSWSTVTATATKRATRAYYIINFDGISGISPVIKIGASVLNYGPDANDFSYGRTAPRWFDNPVYPDLEPSQELWLTTSADEFWEDAIPTRTSAAVNDGAASVSAPVTASPHFHVYDAQRQRFNMGWLAESGKVALYEADSQSQIKLYNVAFYDQGSEGYIEAPDFTVEAVTYFRNRVWAIGIFGTAGQVSDLAIVKDNDTYGAPIDGANSVRYLLALNSNLPAEETDYIEVEQCLPLITLATSNPVILVSFGSDDPSWIHYYTATTHYHSRLYYDYGMVNGNSVWLREPDANVSLR